MLAIAVGLSFAAAQSRAQAYKWKDANGHIHFTENYYEVPEKYRKNLETREMPTAHDPNAAADAAAADTTEVAFEDGVRSATGRDLTVQQQEKLAAWWKAWGTTWLIVGGITLLAHALIHLGLIVHALLNSHVGWGIANFLVGVTTPVYLMMHVEKEMPVRLALLALYLSPSVAIAVAVSQLVSVLS